MNLNRMKQIVLLLLMLLTIPTLGQKKERFEGENELKECVVKVDLYYSGKRNADLMKSVALYENKQLALVTVNKKKETTYTYYYLVETQSSFGPTAYLVEPKFITENLRTKHFVFLDYKPKKHIFYNSECFRENPVSKKLKQKTVAPQVLKTHNKR